MSFGIFVLILTLIYGVLMYTADDAYGIDLIVYTLVYVCLLILSGSIWFIFF